MKNLVIARAEQGVKLAGWDPKDFWGVGVWWGVGCLKSKRGRVQQGLINCGYVRSVCILEADKYPIAQMPDTTEAKLPHD